MIGVWVLDYPPNRFIGSEMMTHNLVKALQQSGEMVQVATIEGGDRYVFEGVPVTHNLTGCDVLLTHVGMPIVGYAIPPKFRVGVCHNAEVETLLTLHTQWFDIVVCNSEHMKSVLEKRDKHEYMVVHPPAPAPNIVSTGDLVTVVNLNDNKVGRFWDIAAQMPSQGFLAVLGGYADQIVPENVPANVEVIDHVPQDQMWKQVWSRTRLLLAPSRRESWNMTAGEALAHGIHTISPDLPGVRENLGDTATYLDRDDVDAWVQAIEDASRPSQVACARAHHNHEQYLSDVESFVKAVNGFGNNHGETS